MLFDFEWLKQGEKFPPVSELSRIKGYKDNASLFEDNTYNVLRPYQIRLMQIVNGLKETDLLNTSFYETPAYWQLSTIKTMDLMVGDEPTIICEKAKDRLTEVLQDSDFISKLSELVVDNDSLGECLIRPYIDKKGKRNFVTQNPQMWFPIVNPENSKEVIADALVWPVCVFADANHPEKNKYELYAKIQYRGEFTCTFRRYKVTGFTKTSNYIDKATKENFGEQSFFDIGVLLEEKTETSPCDQLVIPIPGITTSRNNHGISAYDRITAIVAEIGIRESLGNFILDQNAAPRMAAPDSAFIKDEKTKAWKLKTGGRSFVVAPGAQVPVYVTWDGNLTSNEARIAELKKTLYSMCEMGSVINNDDINSSQGYEALEVKLTNPKAKVRRMAGKFKTPLKKLIAFLLDDAAITDNDVNIIFNEGIPTSESQNITIAQSKKNLGFSFKSIAMEYFGLTEDQAEEEWEKAREESADSFVEQFGGSRNVLFGGNKGGNNGGNGKGGEEPDDDKNGGNKPKNKPDGGGE